MATMKSIPSVHTEQKKNKMLTKNKKKKRKKQKTHSKLSGISRKKH